MTPVANDAVHSPVSQFHLWSFHALSNTHHNSPLLPPPPPPKKKQQQTFTNSQLLSYHSRFHFLNILTAGPPIPRRPPVFGKGGVDI